MRGYFERMCLRNSRDFATPLAPVASHHEPIGGEVVGREVLARPVETPIRRANPRGVPDGAPRAPMIRANFDRAELVETDHAGVRRRGPVERADAFILAAKSGFWALFPGLRTLEGEALVAQDAPQRGGMKLS